MTPYTQLAVEAAKEVGALLLELSKQDIKYQMKSAYDIQADADLQAEKIIIDKIRAQYPDHAILSEEAGKDAAESDYLWIIDPIDGTINFSRHIEEYCISIALRERGQVIAGVIYQPVTGKLYTAEKGQGAYLNGEKIAVSGENELVNSLLATDFSAKIPVRKELLGMLQRIDQQVRHIRIFGSSALHLCRTAEAQLDIYFKPSFNYWDYAAAALIVEEAGGTVTDFDGNPVDEQSQNILATNKALHQVALEMVSEARL